MKTLIFSESYEILTVDQEQWVYMYYTVTNPELDYIDNRQCKVSDYPTPADCLDAYRNVAHVTLRYVINLDFPNMYQ